MKLMHQDHIQHGRLFTLVAYDNIMHVVLCNWSFGAGSTATK